jgi:arginine decarboxylase
MTAIGSRNNLLTNKQAPPIRRSYGNGGSPGQDVLNQRSAEEWTAADSGKLYGVDYWGQGYFGVNDKGHVIVQPTKDPRQAIDLKQLVDELVQRDLSPPLLIRFTEILKHRVNELAGVFNTAIREQNYKGRYRCVYPIKVNQQRHVVEEVRAFGKEHGFGLEAGSKPELLAVLAIVDDGDTPIICNGFKDDQFIESVILATKIGRNIIPVVEKYSELKLIIKYAKQHNVRPKIGIRVKLSAKGSGRWESSGGARSKFGLFISEVLEAVEYLRAEDMLDCLNLLHFHLGSQINNIRNVKKAIIELTRVYVELARIGAGMQYVDVGGGLGIDYDGSKTEFGSSINYSLQEYANDVVYHVKEVCDEAGVAHPTIISESGRATVAYHSVLVFNVLGWSGFERFEIPEISAEERQKLPKPIRLLLEAHEGLTKENFVECYHDALLARDEVLNLFNLGYCTLAQRGLAEKLFYGVCAKVLRLVREMPFVPEEFEGLEQMLSDTFFCNLSIFQSVPDSWAIDQLFPIMPIHRLNERPDCRGVLADITCDSDGKIDQFIDLRDVKPVLELHPYLPDEDYYLGVFLVGAYQEILGDLHNLLGDTNAVHVTIDEAGNPSIDEIVEGDTVTEVLRYVQFDAEDLRRQFRTQVERAVKEGKINLEEARLLRRFYEQGLTGYTYLT